MLIKKTNTIPHRWWVRNVGTVPIQRRSDHGNNADNSQAMAKLYDALQGGDMVCVFPEGVSRYQSGLAPLRPGVGRIVLEVCNCYYYFLFCVGGGVLLSRLPH